MEARAQYPLKIAEGVVSAPFWSAEELEALEPRLYVGTCHSFKGAEADVVYVFPDLTAAAYEEMQRAKGKDAITRAYYVAFTRAKLGLVLCHTMGQIRVW